MILPCRIHRTRKRNRVDSLPLALVFTFCFLASIGEVLSQEALSSASEAAGLGWLPAVPVQITAGVDMGYDDNVNTTSNGQGSVFARENIVLTYSRPSERTQIGLIGVGRFEQFFDLGTDDKNGNVTLSITHHSSTRLSFYASVYAAYETEPDFKSDVGPENVRADHINTIDIFAVTYQWLPRLSTVTNYTFQRVKYASASIGAEQDRMDSTGDSTTPYFEGSLEYIRSNHSLNWTTSYGFEAPTEANASVRKTFRTGLVLTYNLTSRLSSTTAVYFHHDENQSSASSGTGSAGSQDSLDLSLGFNYTINKRLALHANYSYTSQSSLESTPGYSRNSYSAGVTYTY